jgi:hypothetical protein
LRVDDERVVVASHPNREPVFVRPLESFDGHHVRGCFGRGKKTLVGAAHDLERLLGGVGKRPQRRSEPSLGEDRRMNAVGELT